MKTRLSTKGQIVLPAELRRRDGIEPGAEIEIERLGRGEYRLVVQEPPPNAGVVDWLVDCPEKDWFTELEGESTESVAPPRP